MRLLAFLLLLPALPLHAQEAPATDVIADAFEFVSEDARGRFLFSGNVRVSGNNLVVTCDRLDVVTERSGDLNSTIGQLGKIESIVATGNVTITQAGRTATSARADVRPGEGRIVLTGDPVVTDPQGGVMRGERITIIQGERRVLVDNPRITFDRLPDLGFAPDAQPQPAPAPATP